MPINETQRTVGFMTASRYLIQCFEDKKKFPAADVAPVRHGRWLEQHGESYLVFPMKYDEDGLPVLQPYITYECSECGKVVSKQYPYCNCGAKMDGGNSDDNQI